MLVLVLVTELVAVLGGGGAAAGIADPLLLVATGVPTGWPVLAEGGVSVGGAASVVNPPEDLPDVVELDFDSEPDEFEEGEVGLLAGAGTLVPARGVESLDVAVGAVTDGAATDEATPLEGLCTGAAAVVAPPPPMALPIAPSAPGACCGPSPPAPPLPNAIAEEDPGELDASGELGEPETSALLEDPESGFESPPVSPLSSSLSPLSFFVGAWRRVNCAETGVREVGGWAWLSLWWLISSGISPVVLRVSTAAPICS